MKWPWDCEFCARPIDIGTVFFTLETGGVGELCSVLLCCCFCLLPMSTAAAAVVEFFPHCLHLLFTNMRTRLGVAAHCCCYCCCNFSCGCYPLRLPPLMLLFSCQVGYVVVVRVLAAGGTFESVSTAAAAAFIYAIVVDVAAVPALCRPPSLNLQPRCVCLCVCYAHALLLSLLLPLFCTACGPLHTEAGVYPRCC